VRNLRTLLLLTGLVLSPLAACAQSEVTPIPAEAVEEPDIPAASNRIYIDAEYLLWWFGEGRTPVTLTTSSPASKGLPGSPDTKVLYGDQRLSTRHHDRFNGVRLTLGYWFNPEQTVGVEARGLIFERDSTYFKATSDGSKLLALPFIDAATGAPSSQIIAGPGLSGGFVGYSRIELFTEEVNAVLAWLTTPTARVDVLVGARFAQMRDRTDLTSSSKVLPAGATIFGIEDHFRAYDQYYGGQVGLKGEKEWNRCFVNLRGEVSLGGNCESVRAFGESVTATPLTRVVVPHGLFVQGTNTGTTSHVAISSIYEFAGNLGYRLTDRCLVYLGYTLFLWNSPIRSGDQIDTVINASQIAGPLVGPARPSVPFKEDLFWAQGVNAGFDVRW
jgi:hypothetical protein